MVVAVATAVVAAAVTMIVVATAVVAVADTAAVVAVSTRCFSTGAMMGERRHEEVPRFVHDAIGC